MTFRRYTRVLPVITALAGAACGDSTAPVTPASLSVAAGDAQTAAVTTQLAAPLEVAVTGSDGRPMAGVAVAWAVAEGGGTLSASSTLTDANGRAGVRLTLGQAAIVHRVTASTAGLPAVTFQATAVAGPPAVIEILGGGDQTGTVALALPATLALRVADAYGNAVAAARVTFAAAGGGRFDPQEAATDAQGTARSTWTLGTVAGEQVATVATGAVQATVRARAVAAAPAAVERVGGDDQLAPAGTTLATPLVVRVQDTYGNPVPGVTVSFTTPDGGSLTPPQAATAQDGTASTSWRLGPAARQQEAMAAASASVTVAFRAAGTYPGPGILEGAYEHAGTYPTPQRRTFSLSGETVELVAFPGQLVAFLDPGTPAAAATALIKAAGGSVLARIPLTGFYFIGVPAGGEQAAIHALAADARVVSVLPHVPTEPRGGGTALPGRRNARRLPLPVAGGVRVIVIDFCGAADSHGQSVVGSYAQESGGGTAICLDGGQTDETLFRLQEAAARYQGDKILVNISLGPNTTADESFQHWSNRQAKDLEGILNALRALEDAAENIAVTYAAGNDAYPLQEALARVRKDPDNAALLEKHMLIVGVRDAEYANHAKGDPVFAVMGTGSCAGGGQGTSCAAPRALAVLQEVLEKTDVTVADAVLSAQTAANSNANWQLLDDEAVSRAALVKEARDNDPPGAEIITSITFREVGPVTSGVVHPALSGVSVSATVSGTDGYYDALVLRTDAAGSVSFEIPPGAPGVKDTITLMVVLTGVKARWIHAWALAAGDVAASPTVRRVPPP